MVADDIAVRANHVKIGDAKVPDCDGTAFGIERPQGPELLHAT